jgi:hypothetical protein
MLRFDKTDLLHQMTTLQEASLTPLQGTPADRSSSIGLYDDPGAPGPLDDGDSIMGESAVAGSQGTDESTRTSVQRQSIPVYAIIHACTFVSLTRDTFFDTASSLGSDEQIDRIAQQHLKNHGAAIEAWANQLKRDIDDARKNRPSVEVESTIETSLRSFESRLSEIDRSLASIPRMM